MPPLSRWGKTFHLTKETIEEHVNAYQQYLSGRGKIFGGIPTLVDLAAECLANVSLEDSDHESLDDIPPVILRPRIWSWHKIAYPALCCALLCLSLDPDFALDPDSAQNVDEWILLNEKWLRDGNQAEWHHGLVTLGDTDNVFLNSVLSLSGRTIIRSGLLPGYEVLCEACESHVTIQLSVEAFERTFEHMSDGLLKDLNWNNLFVAVYGLSPGEANEKIKHLFETFRANLPAGTPTLVVRNCTTITFYAQYPLRRIQIVLKLGESPKSVLLNFDLDVCAMGWDGTAFWMLPRAARALEKLLKQAFDIDKGYGIRILPSYILSLGTASSDGKKAAPPDVSAIAT
ncbi:hypothetical protein C8R44DRAFT_888899 [Mycena epipterygia]|nr:hypothetical protein C8R44DRAFT_888899 [Mycena epipterygia]